MAESSFARSLRAALRVLRKEILEARRDRNLVLQLVIVPLLLYPTLAFVGIQLVMMARGAAEKEPTVVLVDADTPDPVRDELDADSTLRTRPAPEIWSTLDGAPSAEEFRTLRAAGDPEFGAFEALVAWWSTGAGDSAVVVHDASRERSQVARDRATAAVRAHADSLRAARAASVGLTGDAFRPWAVVIDDLSTAAERGGRALSMILPFLLMLMLPQGTFYAALDTIVGERERGTWETVITSPLSRAEVLLGKLGYVVTASMSTFVLNFTGLLVLVFFALEILLPDAPIALRLEPGAIVVALVAVLLLSVAVSALMMMLVAGARNYREGQAALTPVYLIVAFSGLFAQFGAETFTVSQAAVPLVNVTALLRSALQGETPLVPVVVTLLELVALAVVFVAVAARLVRDENVLFAPDFSVRRALLPSLARSAGKD